MMEMVARATAYAVVAVLAFAAGHYHGRHAELDAATTRAESERAEAENRHVKAQMVSRAKLRDLMANAEIDRRRYRDAIRELREKDREYRNWLATPVPAVAVDFIWPDGVPDNGQSPTIKGGSVADTGTSYAAATGKAGKR
jgi:hypothetical protein